MKQRIYFHTLGCRLNQSETASIQNSFARNPDYEIVDCVENSNIVVINTCTVTEASDDDTSYLTRRISRLNPSVRIALIGCQAQVQKEKLADLPNVRWIIGNGKKMDLLSILNEYPLPQRVQVIAPAIERKAFSQPHAAVDMQHTRANIKIQDGCDFFCSFCEIPYARGRARSRIWQDIMTEGRALAAAGHQEIILTGINIGTYAFEGKVLLDVIKGLEAIEPLKRIRISSIEPTTIDQDILEWMRSQHKLCRHLHIPLQSGDDEILQAMQRQYTIDEFRHFIKQAQTKAPQICLGTDLIVGFPGESEQHFDRTVDFLKEAPLHYAHVFSYSPRKDAKSRSLPTVPVVVVQERSRILRQLSQRKRRLFYESLLGTIQLVLFEKSKDDGWQNGLTDNFVRVKVKSDLNLSNRLLAVQLQKVDGDAVCGQIYE